MNKNILVLLLCIFTLPLAAMNSQVVYDNPQHTSGSFTLLSSDCTQQGWNYYFEVTGLPQNSLIKIDCNYNAGVFANISNDDDCIFDGDGPYSISGSTNSGSSGKLYIYISDEYIGGPYNFTLRFVAGSYSAIEDSYIHGNSIVDGNVGIGTLFPQGKLDIQGSRPISLYSKNYNQSPNGSFGIYSYSSNNAGNVYGIYSYVTGQTGKRWAGYFVGGDVAVSSGNLGVGTTTPKAKIESVTGINAFSATSGNVQSGAALRLRGGDNAVLDFGLYSTNTWIQATDQSNLGLNYNISLNPNGGNVGIGTGTPGAKLDVKISESLGQTAGNYIPLTRINSNGSGNNIYINDYMLRETSGNDWFSASYMRGISVDVSFLNPATLRSWIKQKPYEEKIEFGSSGKTLMSIGKDNTTNEARIIVDGRIHAKEVLVDLNASLADFVFSPTYSLMPLHEVEQFVKTNSHLPEIPSAAEVSKNGMSIGEMQNKMLQKIEELTLYVIEQQKEINQLKASLNPSKGGK